MADFNDTFMRNRDAAVQARTKAQNRSNVLQLKMAGRLLTLISSSADRAESSNWFDSKPVETFEPRPPLEYKPPPEKRKCPPYTTMAQFVSHFAEPGDPEYAPPVQKGETPAERRARIHKVRLEKGAERAAEELKKYDPSNDPNVTGDPYKTLFVARLSYETTEHRIKREFEAYGPIKRVQLVTDKMTNKPRGYAFVEYMHTRDMKTAYKQADGRKLDSRRVLVDVERGRTVPNWRPRRLGGGLGSSRVGGEDLNQKNSGREQQQIASGAPRRSEEPRARDDRHDREKSRERAKDRDRERERSHERSHDRSRDRDSREDRHHRDRDRDRGHDKDRERDRGRDRGRGRDKERDRDRDRARDYDRDRTQDHDRHRERDRERDRDYDRDRDHDETSYEKERGYSHERDAGYDHGEMKHYREQSSTRDRDAEHGERYDKVMKHDHERDYDPYEQPQIQEDFGHHNQSERPENEYYGHEHYDKMQTDDYKNRYDQKEYVPEDGEGIEEQDYKYQH